MSMTTRLGFVGPGAMGAPMVARLLEAGYDLTVWGRTPARLATLVELGARAADRPGDVLAADLVLGCLLDTDVVRERYLGTDGFVHHARSGQVFVEHGTFEPALAVQIGEALAAKGALFLDAPVSGGPDGAATGTLVAMVGGDSHALAQAEGVLSEYCARVVHAGPTGRGLMLKLVNQLLVAVNSVATAEASALVTRLGIDPAAAHDGLMGGWAASRMLDLQMAKAVAGDFSGGGSGIGKFLDVIGLVPGLLASARMPSELFSVVETVFRSTVNDGHADDSFAALVTHYDPGGAAG